MSTGYPESDAKRDSFVIVNILSDFSCLFLCFMFSLFAGDKVDEWFIDFRGKFEEPGFQEFLETSSKIDLKI